MPNHLHAIVVLDKLENNQWNDSHRAHDSNGSHESNGLHVETHGRASLRSKSPPQTKPISSFKPELFRKPQSISSFVSGFNRGSIQKLTTLLININWVFQNTIVIIIFSNKITTITLSETNTIESINTSLIILQVGRMINFISEWSWSPKQHRILTIDLINKLS